VSTKLTLPVPDVHVTNDEGKSRYELKVDGERVGLIAYRREGDRLVMFHTEVDPDRRKQGLASRLVADALADVRERGLTVTPSCPFVGAYIRRHPELADLVA
jgi:uncharacterized protein